MIRDYTTCVIDLNDNLQKQEVEDFLKNELDLGFDKNTEYTVILKRNRTIIATASFAGNVIKQVGILDGLQGQGIAASLIERVIDEMISRKILHVFVYTKSFYENIFVDLGFSVVERIIPHVSLLEWGIYNIEKFINELKSQRVFSKEEEIAAIVVNCNPFTLGHRYLIQRASKENKGVYVFVVEEDSSVFPYDVRLKLVKEGVKDLENVHVIEGGKYIISSVTFPSYFTHEEDIVGVQTALDLKIFLRYIAPTLCIKRRYVGEESYCSVTSQYNEAMKKLLPLQGVEVVEVRRKEIEGAAISASTVRKCIKDGDWDFIKKLVPKSTYKFLNSEEAIQIIQKIKAKNTRH